MRQLFIECHMGIAGDMLCGALLDLLPAGEKETFEKTFSALLDGVTVRVHRKNSAGIDGTKMDVLIEEHHHDHHHHHMTMQEIDAAIDGFALPDEVKENAKAVYALIAKAESKVHGTDVAEVHLHEVGAKDAIIDVTAACFLLHKIAPERIVCSTVTTGYGTVHAAHGVLPAPAPATALLLQGIPTVAGDIKSELCTPTGAALVQYFADGFADGAEMTTSAVGYGLGTKQFDRPNCVRVFLGESAGETVYELRCQVDDMTGEELGYCLNKMLSLGANDAFVTPIVMKKSRPAFALTVLCTPDKKDFFTQQIFRHTTTLGVRQVPCVRQTLSREIEECAGVHIKRSAGDGVTKEKIEFDDLARLADERDASIFEIRREIQSKL